MAGRPTGGPGDAQLRGRRAGDRGERAPGDPAGRERLAGRPPAGRAGQGLPPADGRTRLVEPAGRRGAARRPGQRRAGPRPARTPRVGPGAGRTAESSGVGRLRGLKARGSRAAARLGRCGCRARTEAVRGRRGRPGRPGEAASTVPTARPRRGGPGGGDQGPRHLEPGIGCNRRLRPSARPSRRSRIASGPTTRPPDRSGAGGDRAGSSAHSARQHPSPNPRQASRAIVIESQPPNPATWPTDGSTSSRDRRSNHASPRATADKPGHDGSCPP